MPAPRPLGPTGLPWPLLLALLAWGLLPWERGAGASGPASGPWALGGGLALGLALALALFQGRVPPGPRSLGRVGVGLLQGAGLGLFLVDLLTAEAVGPGQAAATLLALFSLGHWLAGSTPTRDPLLGGLTWVAVALVLLFIPYPLWVLLRTLDLGRIPALLADGRFLLLENPYTPASEAALALAVGGVGALVGLLAARGRRFLGLGVGLALGLAVGLALFGRGALPTSLLVAGVVAPLATLLGLGFALLEYSQAPPWTRALLRGLALLPLISPPFILAFALILAFGRNGFVTHHLLGLDQNLLYGPLGVILAQVLAFTPVAYMVIRGTVQNLEHSLMEAAATLGAHPWRVFRTVTWPLLRPGLANAFLLTVLESLSDFGNPLILGGDRQYLATEVFVAFTGRYDPVEASFYGVVLLLLVFLVFFLQYRWLGRAAFITATGRPSRGGGGPLPPGLGAVLAGVFLLWAVLTLGLYGSVAVGSLVKLWGFDYTFTLRHYQDFLVLGLPVFLNTLKVALYAAAPTALLGLFLAYVLQRQELPGKRVLEAMTLLSFAMPGTAMGVGYVLAFNPSPWVLTGTTLILVLALVFREVPVGVRAGVAGLAQVDRSLEEASATLGASPLRTLARVVLPLLFPAFLAGLIFAFVRGMTAVSQVVFLVGPGNLLATVLLLGWVEQGQMGRAAVMSTVMVLSLVAATLLLWPLNRRLDVRLGGLP